MNTRQRNFIVVTALLVVVGTVVFALNRPGDEARSGESGRSSAAAAANSEGSRPAFHTRAKTTRRDTGEPGKLGTRPESGPMVVEIDAAGSGDPDLAGKAARVETHAKKRLEALDDQLHLTESQKRRIFPLLVRNSESYDPAMSVSNGGGVLAGGRPGDGPLSDQDVRAGIQDALDPAQRGELVERDLDEMMLWEEIIENLVRRLDESGPGQPTASDPAAPAADDSGSLPSSRGGRNLYDDSESSR